MDIASRRWGALPLGAVAGAGVLLGRRALGQARRHSAIGWSPAGGRLHRGALTTRTLGDGPPLVLLHGFAASGRFWGAVYDQLAADRRLIVPDLLGFGDSPKPETGYSAEDHADAIARTLIELAGPTPAVVAAHSLGCVIAFQLATRHPDLVSGVVGFGPPLYRNRTHAQKRLSNLGLLVRLFALGASGAKAVSVWVCRAPPKAGRVARARSVRTSPLR